MRDRATRGVLVWPDERRRWILESLRVPCVITESAVSRRSQEALWILPALALSKLKLRDVMGYTVIMMLWVGVIHITAVLAWGYLTH